ncbi:hypothetical protein E4U42_003450 [Claviceps africana]|uniref:Ureidoglycolate hydrolase n=1 Tax=Claviceps africana TaxID=83212 RepID=A0A8K0J6V4_9HYPO|nr:hypothetical protein E4U42_003450 [Claviceps africana]
MAVTIRLGRQDVRVTAQRLAQESFSPFGSVISNPRPDLLPSAALSSNATTVSSSSASASASVSASTSNLPAHAVSANQGSAIQYRHVARIRTLYDQAPSGVVADPVMSMFVCAARELSRVDDDDDDDEEEGAFAVRVLERHPFTTQTFSPLSSTAHAYLVIVAPSLPPSDERDGHLPVPAGAGDDHDLPGRGLPDLRRLRAFVATDGQAVTYGAGTWHAPMVVLGRAGTTLDFVVSQFSNGVAVEDCQLVELEEGVEVRVKGGQRMAKL